MIKNPQLEYLSQEITYLKEVGSYLSSRLNGKSIITIMDLLLFLPISCYRIKSCRYVSELELGSVCAINVTIKQITKLPNRKNLVKISCIDNIGKMFYINMFNANIGYVKSTYQIDEQKTIVGSISDKNYTMSNPLAVYDSNDSIEKNIYNYSKIAGVSNVKIRSLINIALTHLKSLECKEWLAQNIISHFALPSLADSLYNLHNMEPDKHYSSKSFLRIAIEEFINYQYLLNNLSSNSNSNNYIEYKINTEKLKQLESSLPFTLTEEQQNSIEDIKKDMQGAKQMKRLIQGDVGSGKTIVAVYACLIAITNGYQACIMSPTEVLTKQHLKVFKSFLEQFNLNITLLTGQEKGKKRLEILKQLANNEIDILVSTHAAFQEDVVFKNLGLVIIDEQHRFGVKQRTQLLNKGYNVDLLLTTATPIPRTLSLCLYSKIDISQIKHKPKNRKPIITQVISNDKINNVIARVEKAIAENKKIYWVCPLIEESEQLDLNSAQSRMEYIAKNTNIAINNLYLLHGKMKSKEKNDTLLAFKNSVSGLLIATTVIEVGIDIPDCNIMIIEDAHHFGMSQLHQLRGRVGRSDEQAVCLLIYNQDNITYTGKQRLAIMKRSSDGFYISEQDFKIRGSGNIMGTQQSGFKSLKIFTINSASDIILFLSTITNCYVSSEIYNYMKPIFYSTLDKIDCIQEIMN